MKSINSRIVYRIAIILIASIAFFAYRFFNTPAISLMHYSIAQQQFATENNEQKFTTYKQQLTSFYLSGAYEQEVSVLCAKALEYFSKIISQPDECIIFDIDDTALYHYQWFDKFDFIWKHQPLLIKARQVKQDPPITSVLNLYKQLINKGFTIIFLSSRNAGSKKNTENELHSAGYTTFKELILMPDELSFDHSIKTEEWKLSTRKKLSAKYTIIGNIGDRAKDFFGGYNGYEVKLPNYLY